MSQKWVIMHFINLKKFRNNAKSKTIQNALKTVTKEMKKQFWRFLSKIGFFSQVFLRNFSVDLEKNIPVKIDSFDGFLPYKIVDCTDFRIKRSWQMIFKVFSGRRNFFITDVILMLTSFRNKWWWKTPKIRIFGSEKANNRKFTWRL